jgi:hypothetical protein
MLASQEGLKIVWAGEGYLKNMEHIRIGIYKVNPLDSLHFQLYICGLLESGMDS